MKTPYYRKTGLPGLSGTHNKNSPLQSITGILAVLGKIAKVGMAVGKGVKKFTKNHPKTTAAILGGVKSGIDKGKAEIEQSVYASKQNEKENRSNFASMNFGGGGPLSRKIKKY